MERIRQHLPLRLQLFDGRAEPAFATNSAPFLLRETAPPVFVLRG